MSERSLVIQGYVWLMTPVVLFVAFWFRPEVAVPVLAALACCAWRLFSPRRAAALHDARYGGVALPRRCLVMAAAITFYVLLCGIGGFVAQMPNDHAWRNAVFFDLARRDWPVAYGGGDDPMLCYYFGFWLPAAIVCKAAGGIIRAGDIAQVIYAAWGTWITVGMIFSMTGGRPRWSVLLIFVGFNAWDAVTAFFFSDEYFSILEDPWSHQLMWLSTASTRFAASANPVIYNFIYNQGIPLWVFMSLLLHDRRSHGRLLLLYGMLPLFAPIPALALFPWFAARSLRNLRRMLTAENVTGLLIALLASAFLLQNNSGGRLRLVDADGSYSLQLLLALAYYALSFGVFVIFIWRYVKRDWLYWSLLAMSVLSALVGVGTTPDLAWRMSMPAVMMTVILLCRRWTGMRGGSVAVRLAFVAALAIGSFSSIWSVAFTVHEEMAVRRGERQRKYIFMMGHIDDPDQPYYNNFISTGGSIYRRHLRPNR